MKTKFNFGFYFGMGIGIILSIKNFLINGLTRTNIFSSIVATVVTAFILNWLYKFYLKKHSKKTNN
jgi:hypothetical protein